MEVMMLSTHQPWFWPTKTPPSIQDLSNKLLGRCEATLLSRGSFDEIEPVSHITGRCFQLCLEASRRPIGIVLGTSICVPILLKKLEAEAGGFA